MLASCNPLFSGYQWHSQDLVVRVLSVKYGEGCLFPMEKWSGEGLCPFPEFFLFSFCVNNDVFWCIFGTIVRN